MNAEPNAGPNYRILAQRFMFSKQWDRSLAASLEWLAREPENPQAHRIAAQSLINLERHAEAEKHLEKVLANNPADDFAHRLMSMVYFGRGKFKAADEAIRKSISINPNDAYHWQHLAHMSYRRRDLATARKCVARARELNPRDANILSLAILCEPRNRAMAGQKIQGYQDALALDPENASIYNNLGFEYLNQSKDYARAEECFRRALFFKPTSPLFRKNLFIVLKKRDLIYRILSTPKDWLLETVNFFSRARAKSILLYLLLIPVWLLAFRFIIGGLLLWCALVWPLVKFYEYLTIGDLQSRAGEIGVRRGGFLGYRQWPVKVRLSIFALVLILFWGAVAFFCFGNFPPAYRDLGRGILGILAIMTVPVFIGYFLKQIVKTNIKAWSARRRARQMASLVDYRRKG